jgi:hypothetical protein
VTSFARSIFDILVVHVGSCLLACLLALHAAFEEYFVIGWIGLLPIVIRACRGGRVGKKQIFFRLSGIAGWVL